MCYLRCFPGDTPEVQPPYDVDEPMSAGASGEQTLEEKIVAQLHTIYDSVSDEDLTNTSYKAVKKRLEASLNMKVKKEKTFILSTMRDMLVKRGLAEEPPQEDQAEPVPAAEIPADYPEEEMVPVKRKLLRRRLSDDDPRFDIESFLSEVETTGSFSVGGCASELPDAPILQVEVPTHAYIKHRLHVA